ncbi:MULTISPECIES: DUF4190 domain-containing protein [unclassified Pseudonocardia]|uniref:DUF4190 domain-containing protein n=1 Tax=unclassified Pseudonocardia TaxID=2619320 RepID=UPI0001FFF1C1|nr:DUF4190 domain-containing protein [Pseudonocardia sp. Ae707_Ps1]
MTSPAQPPFPPGPPYPPPHGWPVQRPQRNGLGTAALVLGILGALFSLIPIIGVIAWPMVVIGLVLGVLGIVRANAGKADNRGVAISGTVLSAFGLAFCLLYTVAFASAVSDSSSSTASATGGSAPSGPATAGVENADRTYSAPAPARPTSGAPGDTLTTRDGLELTTTPLRDRSDFMGPVRCTDVTYRNTGSGTASFNIWDWQLQDPDGVIRRISIGSDNDLSSGQLAPGGTVSGQVCFDAKADATGTWTVIYEGGLFSSEDLTWAG